METTDVTTESPKMDYAAAAKAFLGVVAAVIVGIYAAQALQGVFGK